MNYTVIWHREALNELTVVWMTAADREAVTVASAQIDRLLRASPLDQGESREDSTRVLFILPLGIEYDVEEGDRKVCVNSVWQIRGYACYDFSALYVSFPALLGPDIAAV